MGQLCSLQQQCTESCTCFDHDDKMQSKQVIRYRQQKWEWNTEHDEALIDALCRSYYNLPKVIVDLIKDHTYNSSELYYITISVIENEKYYPKVNDLLNKQLCPSWYNLNLSLLIALHCTSYVHVE